MRMLFGFRGRINRAKYWLAALMWVLYLLVVGGGAYAAVGDVIGFRRGGPLSGHQILLAIGFMLLCLVPTGISGIAIGIKRLHDRDKSGWWLLLFYVGPFAFSLLPGIASWLEGTTARDFLSTYVDLVSSIASFAINLWAFVELGCLRGTEGPNRYGPDPLARDPVTGAR